MMTAAHLQTVDLLSTSIDNLPNILPALLSAIDTGFGHPPFPPQGAPSAFVVALARLGDILENVASCRLVEARSVKPGVAPPPTHILQRRCNACGRSIGAFLKCLADRTSVALSSRGGDASLSYTYPFDAKETADAISALPEMKSALGIVGAAFLRAYGGENKAEGTHAMDLRALYHLCRVVVNLGVLVPQLGSSSTQQSLLEKTTAAAQEHFGLTHPLHVRLRLATGTTLADENFVKAFLAAVTAVAPTEKSLPTVPASAAAASSSTNDLLRQTLLSPKSSDDVIDIFTAAAATRFTPVSRQATYEACNHSARLQRMLSQSCMPNSLNNILESVCATPAQRASIETKQLSSKVLFMCGDAEPHPHHTTLFQAVLGREAEEEYAKKKAVNAHMHDLTLTSLILLAAGDDAGAAGGGKKKAQAGAAAAAAAEGFEAARDQACFRLGDFTEKKLLRRAARFLLEMHSRENQNSSNDKVTSSPMIGCVILSRHCVAAFHSPRLTRVLSRSSNPPQHQRLQQSQETCSASEFDAEGFAVKYACGGAHSLLVSSVARSVVGAIALCADGLEKCFADFGSAKEQQQPTKGGTKKPGGKGNSTSSCNSNQQPQPKPAPAAAAAPHLSPDAAFGCALKSWLALSLETQKLLSAIIGGGGSSSSDGQSSPNLIPLSVVVSNAHFSPASRKLAVLKLFTIAKHLAQLVRVASPALRGVLVAGVQLLSSAAVILGEALSKASMPADDAEVNALRRIVVFVFVAVTLASDSNEASLSENSSAATFLCEATAPSNNNNNNNNNKNCAASASQAASSGQQQSDQAATQALLQQAVDSPKAALALVPRWKIVVLRDFLSKAISSLGVPIRFFFVDTTFLAHCTLVTRSRGGATKEQPASAVADEASSTTLRVSLLLAALMRYPDRGFLVAMLKSLRQAQRQRRAADGNEATEESLDQLFLHLFRQSDGNLVPSLSRRHNMFLAAFASFSIESVSTTTSSSSSSYLPASLLVTYRAAAVKALAVLVRDDSPTAHRVVHQLLAFAARDRVARVAAQAGASDAVKMSKSKNGNAKSGNNNENNNLVSSEMWPTLFLSDGNRSEDHSPSSSASSSSSSSASLASTLSSMHGDDDIVRAELRHEAIRLMQAAEARAELKQQQLIEAARAKNEKDEVGRRKLEALQEAGNARRQKAAERAARIQEAGAAVEKERLARIEAERSGIEARAKAAKQKAEELARAKEEERRKREKERVSRLREVEAAVILMQNEIDDINGTDINGARYERDSSKLISSAEKSAAILRVRADPTLRLQDLLERIIALSSAAASSSSYPCETGTMRVPLDIIERRQTEVSISVLGYDPKKTTIRDPFSEEQQKQTASAAPAAKTNSNSAPKMLWEEFLEEDEQEQQRIATEEAQEEFGLQDGADATNGDAPAVSMHMRLAPVLDLFAPSEPFDSWRHAPWRVLLFRHGLDRAQIDWSAVRDVFQATNSRLWARLNGQQLLQECIDRKLVEKHPSSPTVRITRLGVAYHAPFFAATGSFAEQLVQFNRDRVKALLMRAAEKEAKEMLGDGDGFDLYLRAGEGGNDFAGRARDDDDEEDNNDDDDDDDEIAQQARGGWRNALFGDDFLV